MRVSSSSNLQQAAMRSQPSVHYCRNIVQAFTMNFQPALQAIAVKKGRENCKWHSLTYSSTHSRAPPLVLRTPAPVRLLMAFAAATCRSIRAAIAPTSVDFCLLTSCLSALCLLALYARRVLLHKFIAMGSLRKEPARRFRPTKFVKFDATAPPMEVADRSLRTAEVDLFGSGAFVIVRLPSGRQRLAPIPNKTTNYGRIMPAVQI